MIWTASILFAVLQINEDRAVADRSVTFSLVAVQATNEDRVEKYIDPKLRSVRSAVSALAFDTFRQIKSTRRTYRYGREGQWSIDGRYTLHITPVERNPDSRVRIKVRLTLVRRSANAKPVDVLDTTLIMAVGKHLNLGGMKLGAGELIVVISL